MVRVGLSFGDGCDSLLTLGMTTHPLTAPLLARPHRPRDLVELRRAAAFGGFDILRATYTRHSFSPHFHGTYAIGVITRGACAMKCRGSTYLLQAGHVILLSPGEVHTGEQVGHEGWSYRMMFPPASAVIAAARVDPAALARGDLISFRSPVVNDRALARWLLGYYDALSGSTGPIQQEAMTVRVLATLVEMHAELRREPPRATRHAMQQVRDYMDVHCVEPLTLAEISRVAGLSCFYVVRQFHATFGLPPHAYLGMLRLERARTLLREGMPIAQAAVAAGFSDQSHLTRFFRRVFGMTPGVYARAMRAR